MKKHARRTPLKQALLWPGVTLLLILQLSCMPDKGGSAAYDLSLSEGFANPVGFYDSLPSFSWKLPPGVLAQSAYSLVAASSPDLLPGDADLWESGKMDSDRNLYVPYEGLRLSSRQKVYWQVKFWDENGAESPWSERAFFELGLLDKADWTARWISLPGQQAVEIPEIDRRVHRVQYLRKDLELPGEVESARLYVTALGLFRAHINGQRVGMHEFSPGWTPYQQRVETLSYDVKALLKQGPNAMGLELAEGWHSGRLIFRRYADVHPKALAQLEVKYKNGIRETFITDNSWTGTVNGPIRYASIYDGESYDASLEMPGWSAPDFDDSAWSAVEEGSIAEEVELTPKRHNSVTTKIILPTKAITETAPGKVVFDLGQNMAGVPQLKIPVKKGQQVKIRFAEMLQANGEIYTDNYRGAVSTDFYLPARDGMVEWQPAFTFHGFRYVELRGFDESHPPERSWVNGLVWHSDFDQSGNFSSSHEKLNQLQSNIEWGLRGNFLDIPTDCPQRDERAGWTGDAQVFVPTSMFIADAHAFWSAWMQSLREDQRADGSVPIVVPDIDGRRVSSGWGDAATIIPWEIYLRTGDEKILRDSYESMLAWIEYYASVSENHIVDMFTYGDWLQPLSKHPRDERKGETHEKLISTAYYARSVDICMQTAEVLGIPEDRARLEGLLAEIQRAFQEHFFREDGSVSKGVPTQTAYLMAIGFDLLSPALEEKATAHLIAEIEKANTHLRTGFLGTPLLAPVLEKIGRTDLMFDMLFKESYPSWFYSINQGATTMWERWDSYTREDGFHPAGMNSFNHYAYGAIGQFLYERIAGIKALKPGYKAFLIAPLPGGGLSSAQATYDSPYGKICAAWKIEDGVFHLHATIPPNTTAKIILPADRDGSLLIDGHPYSDHARIKLVKKGEKAFELLAEPGTYHLKAIPIDEI